MLRLQENALSKMMQLRLSLGAIKNNFGTWYSDSKQFPRDAKIMMAGLKNMYECTNCHKFIPVIESKDAAQN